MEGSHLNNNKTIIFFFSGGKQVALVQSLGMAFSFRVPNPSYYCRFWSMAVSDKHVYQYADLEESVFRRRAKLSCVPSYLNACTCSLSFVYTSSSRNEWSTASHSGVLTSQR